MPTRDEQFPEVRPHSNPIPGKNTRFNSLLCALTFSGSVVSANAVTPPTGFTALFNGKDFTGWRGGDTFDHRKYLAMSDEQRAVQDTQWTADMKAHWHVEGGELVNGGHGKYAATVKAP